MSEIDWFQSEHVFFRQQLHKHHLFPSIPVVFEKTGHDENLRVFLWNMSFMHVRQSGNKFEKILLNQTCYFTFVGGCFWVSANCQGYSVDFLPGEQETVPCVLAHC